MDINSPLYQLPKQSVSWSQVFHREGFPKAMNSFIQYAVMGDDLGGEPDMTRRLRTGVLDMMFLAKAQLFITSMTMLVMSEIRFNSRVPGPAALQIKDFSRPRPF
jgi:hypothetical protein